MGVGAAPSSAEDMTLALLPGFKWGGYCVAGNDGLKDAAPVSPCGNMRFDTGKAQLWAERRNQRQLGVEAGINIGGGL